MTDAQYRSAYFDPLADHLAVSLVARDRYLAHLGDELVPGRFTEPAGY